MKTYEFPQKMIDAVKKLEENPGGGCLSCDAKSGFVCSHVVVNRSRTYRSPFAEIVDWDDDAREQVESIRAHIEHCDRWLSILTPEAT